MRASYPDIRVRSAYQLPYSLLKELGIKVLLFDMDNTLASFYETFKDVEGKVRALKDECLENGFQIAIASNGQGKRVANFAKELAIPFFPMLMKPFSFKLKRLLKKEGWKENEVALIGDQLMTDFKAARGAHIRFVLSDKLTEKEPFFTRFNRLFEKNKRKTIERLPYDTLLNKEGATWKK